jgi:hypothetical protein
MRATAYFAAGVTHVIQVTPELFAKAKDLDVFVPPKGGRDLQDGDTLVLHDGNGNEVRKRIATVVKFSENISVIYCSAFDPSDSI